MATLDPNSYAYLWNPTRQMLDKNGKPLVGGYVMLNMHGTTGVPALSYSDWNGTLNARQIRLDSLGRASAIVENDKQYDMYVYNRWNVLEYSALGVNCEGESGGGNLRFTSSDGSVIITRTGNAVDLKVFQDTKIYGSATADSVDSNGIIEFDTINSGDITVVSAGAIRIGLGKLYHITVALEFNTNTVTPEYHICRLVDSENTSHNFSLDGSRTTQLVELSWDAVSTSDIFRLYIQAPSEFSVTSAELYIHAVNPVVGGSAPQMQSDWDVTDIDSPAFIKNKPDLSVYARIADLAAVAFSGAYDDLTGKPDLSVFARTADLASVAFSGSYNDLSNVPANLVQDADYVHTDNNFTDSDKSKLDGIAAGAEVNVQANWNESDTSSDAYIQNKPNMANYALIADLAAVAFSGAYSDLSGAPDPSDYTPRSAVCADWVSGLAIYAGYYRWDTEVGRVYRAKVDISAASNTVAPHSATDKWEWVRIVEAGGAVYHVFDPYNGPSISSEEIEGVIRSKRSIYLVTHKESGTTAVDAVYNGIYFLTRHAYGGDPRTYRFTYLGHNSNGQFCWSQYRLTYSIANGDSWDLRFRGEYPIGVKYYGGTGISIADRSDGDKTINCTLDPFPTHTAANADDIITVNSSNELIWKTLAAVAHTGSYNDLSNKPTIPPAQVQSDWTETDDTKKSFILNKPTKTFITAGQNITIVEVDNQLVISAAGGGVGTVNDVTVNGTSVVDGNGVAVIDLTPYVLASALATVATTGDYSDLSNTPDLSVYALISSLAAVATSGDYTDLSNKPDLSVYALASSLAAVATSGSYSDLSNKPDLSVYALASSLAAVATSGSYNDLSDKPTIPTITYTTSQEVTDILADLT